MQSRFLPFKILGIHHIAIASEDGVDGDMSQFLRDLLGLDFLGEEAVHAEKTHTSFFASAHEDVSKSGLKEHAKTQLEIISPLDSSGVVAKFLAKRGAGIHHLAFKVDDIDSAVIYLKEQGVRLVHNVPRQGAHGTRVVFIHPKSSGGVLVELVEDPRTAQS
ncbi:MAG: methylmalonyl-CoA epimerase [Proteobacteria bacterium]|nr:methylmalonyl-CoA epimerase [Pseudomonadota bacterium]